MGPATQAEWGSSLHLGPRENGTHKLGAEADPGPKCSKKVSSLVSGMFR